jgi:hypothetical protein
VFGIACAIEVTQALQLAQLLGLAKGSVLRVALGDTFEWGDIFCYLTGSVLTFSADVLVARPG